MSHKGVERSEVTVTVPKDCYSYPGGGTEGRSIVYQKICVTPSVDDGVRYVAVEAKVHRYHHYVTFARFKLVEKTGHPDVAILEAIESISVDYEHDGPEYAPRTLALLSEVIALVPPGCELRVSPRGASSPASAPPPSSAPLFMPPFNTKLSLLLSSMIMDDGGDRRARASPRNVFEIDFTPKNAIQLSPCPEDVWRM